MRPDPFDPHRDAIYAAEHAAMPDEGRRFGRFRDVCDYVESTVLGSWWERMFPDAPIEVAVERRSRTATFSAAHVVADGSEGVIFLRDGSWNAVTIVHELAHVAAIGSAPTGSDPSGPHGAAFATALLQLWREHLGVHAYGALRSALDDHGVPYQRDRLDGSRNV